MLKPLTLRSFPLSLTSIWFSTSTCLDNTIVFVSFELTNIASMAHVWQSMGLTKEETLEITYFVYPLMDNNTTLLQHETLEKICSRFSGNQQVYAIYLTGFTACNRTWKTMIGMPFVLDPNDVDYHSE